MIRSMTGFGRAERRAGSLLVGVEIRCVNHRFAEVRVKVPRTLSALEEPLRKRLAAAIGRGRADATVSVSGTESRNPVAVNQELVAAYLKAGAEISRKHKIEGSLPMASLLSLPGVVTVRAENGALSAAQRKVVEGAFEAALREVLRARSREGKHLVKDIRRRLRVIAGHRAALGRRARGASSRHERRLQERLADLGATSKVDPARLAQEVAILASRSDVTEELVRLEGHVLQAGRLLGKPREPVGKKMDFLLQEMHREANTINSKSEDLEISRLSLAVKAEVEKIREQSQNLE